MNTFEILLVILLSLSTVVLTLLCICYITTHKKQNEKDAILSHRELWLYYLNEPELAGILSNNNGKSEKEINIEPENLTEKQYRFLVLFLNHMETMLPSWKKYEKDWIGLFKNPCLRYVYEKTKLYRNKNFCKLIDSIISSYNNS